ncbi:hypothetical protein Taro_006145 [Colocasia esculenta]|uniref:Uncharacterized protein n=1 Tax=Colocasia esculenta TaxID=4460 RepID=A0A843TWC0_COLES|nr:hypothetical protein [Colocasia esculenta]
MADEREKAVDEYRTSAELKSEVAGLFREDYKCCLDRVKDLHAELDLSELVLSAGGGEDGGEDDGEIAAMMASGGGSYSGSRPRRQRITSQQTIPTHSASEGSTVAASTGQFLHKLGVEDMDVGAPPEV